MTVRAYHFRACEKIRGKSVVFRHFHFFKDLLNQIKICVSPVRKSEDVFPSPQIGQRTIS